MKILQKFKKKFSSDDGGSGMITFLIIIPILLAFMITVIDTSVYFSNRSQVTAAARDGARTIAIMGGNGTNTTATIIEKSYGMNRGEACRESDFAPGFKNAIKNTSTPVECNIVRSIQGNTGLISVSFDSPDTGVSCGPTISTSIGSRTYCEVTFDYNGLPGSPISWVKKTDGSGLLGKSTVIASGESEVDLSNTPLQNR